MTFHPEAFQATQISVRDGSLNDVNIPPYYPDGESEPFIPLAHVKVEHDNDREERNDPQEDPNDRDYKVGDILDEDDDDEVKPTAAYAPKKPIKYENDNFEDTGEKILPCHKCGVEFSTPGFLKTHVRRAHGLQSTRPFQCPECQVDCLFKRTLKAHLLKVHNVDPSPKKEKLEKCVCTLCGKHLHAKYLHQHERLKHGIDRRDKQPIQIECTKCNTIFETTLELDKHVQVCQEIAKGFNCAHCELKWASGPMLNLHLKKDHGVLEVFTCEICGKCFKVKASVESHINIDHTFKRDFVCHTCGKEFVRKQALKHHMVNVHENSGKHECGLCDYRTSRKDRLDLHVNQVHTKKIKYECDRCDFFSYSQGNLRSHIRIVHLKIKPFKCSVCQKAFARAKELESHQRKNCH